jgi:hypothetical protein
LVWASIASLAASLALPARAEMVAGWDFSQYLAAGFLTLDPGAATYVNTLDANYSDFDPTFNAGAESAAFGTMRMDGSAGSTTVDPNPGSNPVFVPTDFSLVSNLDAPVVNPFDSFQLLQEEGQVLANPLSMLARGPVNVVFEADLTSVPETGSNWSVRFGGRTFSGTSTVTIDFSTDGASYGSFGSVQLTEVDTAYSVDLGTAPSETGYVRLGFDPVGIDQPIIDNVSIHVPEPGGELLAVTAWLTLQGLMTFRRRRATALPRH